MAVKTKEQIETVWKKFIETKTEESSCPELKKQLVEHYYPIVKNIASRMRVNRKIKDLSVDELTSFGVDGLYDSIEKFDPVMFSNKFETYATHRIRGSIFDHLRNLDWTPRLTRTKINKYETQKQILENQLGRKASSEEIRESMNITEKDEKKIKVPNIFSMNSSSSRDNYDEDSAYSIEDEKSVQPLDSILRTEFFKKLTSISFTPIEKKIIWLYYWERKSMREISEEIEISESRISQMHNKILARLKEKIEKNPKYFSDIISVVKNFKQNYFV